jgi:hypothetical protein
MFDMTPMLKPKMKAVHKHRMLTLGYLSRSEIFHWHGDVTIAGEGLQDLGLCLALRVFEQGGIFIVPHVLWQEGVFIVPHLLWHVASGFSSLIRRIAPCIVAFYDTLGDAEDLFTSGSIRVEVWVGMWNFLDKIIFMIFAYSTCLCF